MIRKESSDMGERRRFRARVRGRVQGVFFRASTAERAGQLGLAGWVRNRSGGDVELEAEGLVDALELLLAFVRTGPPAARVDEVEVEWLAATGVDAGFRVRR